MVGVPDAGVDGARAGDKRGGRARRARGEQLPEGSGSELATRVHAGLLAAGAHRFADQEPTGDFVWLFINRDGSIAERPTTLDNYLTFRRMYGVPEGRWRDG